MMDDVLVQMLAEQLDVTNKALQGLLALMATKSIADRYVCVEINDKWIQDSTSIINQFKEDNMG